MPGVFVRKAESADGFLPLGSACAGQIPEGVACGAAPLVARACVVAAVGSPLGTLADRLAARTLELVDIPSESLHEAEIRERLRAAVPAPFDEVYAGDEAFLWARERRPDAPCSCWQATTTPSLHRTTSRVASRTAGSSAAGRAT